VPNSVTGKLTKTNFADCEEDLPTAKPLRKKIHTMKAASTRLEYNERRVKRATIEGDESKLFVFELVFA
jgi:hypothetical protein